MGDVTPRPGPNRRHASWVTLVLLLTACASPEPQRTTVLAVYRDYAPPPATPAEMAQAADAVVIAKYTGKRRSVADRPADLRAAFTTDYTFEILRVVKQHFLLGNVGDEFQINLAGGVRDVGRDRVQHFILDANALRENGDYVVFLKKNSSLDELYIAWQQSALFELTASGVLAMDRRKTQHDGKAREAFLVEIQGQ